MSRTLSSVFSRGKRIDVEINLQLNGQDIIGPITGESLAIIAKFGAYGPDDDILNFMSPPFSGLKMYIRYVERKK